MTRLFALLTATLLLPFAAPRAQTPASAPSSRTIAADEGGPPLSLTEWSLPRPEARAHATFVSSRGGFVWYSDTAANRLGRVDPKTGVVEEFRLRPGTEPYGFVEHYGSGIQTTVYFTSRSGGYVGEFDLNTREVREFRLEQKGRLRDIAFDPNGDVWFTMTPGGAAGNQGGKVGHLNLFSAEMKLIDVATRGAVPFVLAVNSVGIPYFTERDAPRIGSVHPMTYKVSEHTLPDPKSGVYGIAVTPDDTVWYTDRARGCLGRFDPSTKRFEEFASPGGAVSRPSALINAGSLLWYVEAGATPRLVRFDPGSKTFHSWTLKTAGEVDHLYASADGSIWFGMPSTNHIAKAVAATDSH